MNSYGSAGRVAEDADSGVGDVAVVDERDPPGVTQAGQVLAALIAGAATSTEAEKIAGRIVA